jgi:hypothetical protein
MIKLQTERALSYSTTMGWAWLEVGTVLATSRRLCWRQRHRHALERRYWSVCRRRNVSAIVVLALLSIGGATMLLKVLLNVLVDYYISRSLLTNSSKSSLLDISYTLSKGRRIYLC